MNKSKSGRRNRDNLMAMDPSESLIPDLKRRIEEFRQASMAREPLWCILEAPGFSPMPCPHVHEMFSSTNTLYIYVHNARIPVVQTVVRPFHDDESGNPPGPEIPIVENNKIWFLRGRSLDTRVFYFASSDPQSLKRYTSLCRVTVRILKSARGLPDWLTRCLHDHVCPLDSEWIHTDWTRLLFESVWLKQAPASLSADRWSWWQHNRWSYDPSRNQAAPEEIIKLCEAAGQPREHARHYYCAEMDPELFTASAEMLEYIISSIDRERRAPIQTKPVTPESEWPTALKLRRAVTPEVSLSAFYRIRTMAKVLHKATASQIRGHRFPPQEVDRLIEVLDPKHQHRALELKAAWMKWSSSCGTSAKR